MGHLTRHRRPGLVSFGLCELFCGVVEVVYHQVVGPDEAGDLVLLLVDDIFKVVDACLVHLPPHFRERLEHLVHRRGGDESCQNEKDHEHGDDGDGVQHRLGPEVKALVRERRAHDRYHSALDVEHRRVEEIGILGTYCLLADVVPLVLVDDVLESVRVHP